MPPPAPPAAATHDPARQMRSEGPSAAQAAKRAAVSSRADAAGLHGVHAAVGDVFRGEPSASELARLSELRAGTRQLIAESVDPSRLQSALAHFELWREELPSRVAFLPLTGAGSPGRLEAARYNEESLALFLASCLRRGSLQRGRLGQPIAVDTAQGYVSALRAELTRDSGVQALVPEANVPVRAAARGARRGQPPTRGRRRRRGLRARHLRAAAANAAFDRASTWDARRRWLAIVLQHRLVARGGEMGRVNGKPFRASRGLTWADVQWHAAGTLSDAHAAASVHMCHVKDPDGRGQRHVIPVRAHATAAARGGRREDALCAYALLRAAWREDLALLGRRAALAAPIFRREANGGAETAFATKDMAAIAKAVASAAGEPPCDFAAHSARIGGATDYRDLKGAEAGKRILKAFGRWRGDIANIYTRMAVDESLEASGNVAGVRTRELEAVFAGFTEPAAR